MLKKIYVRPCLWNRLETVFHKLHFTGDFTQSLYWKSDLCIHRNETAWARSNSYIHVSVSALYIPRIGLFMWLQQNKQTDPGNI